MNEYYSIAEYNKEPIDEYQLKNKGERRVSISSGKAIRDGYGGTTYQRNEITSKVTSQDYDNSFVHKLLIVNPPYDLEKTIDYHQNHYVKNGGEKDRFLKHIRYVVLEKFKKFYPDNRVQIQLIEKFLSEQQPKSTSNQFMGNNITGNNNFVNVAGGDIHQSGITINITENQFKELKELGVEDSHIEELKTIVDNKSLDKPTMKDKISKWLTPVIISLTAKGLTEGLPKLLEFAHQLMP